MEYRRCNRCVMDNNADTSIIFDEKGYCNYCTEALINKELVYFPNEKGKEKLIKLIKTIKKKGKNKKYDCMMGISGGLDSSYLAYLGYKWGLRILAVHVDDEFDTEVAKDNIQKLCKACNIELLTVKPDKEQFIDLTKSFILAEVPDIAIPQDNILFSCLYELAKKNKIHTFLSGGNFALESILKSSSGHNSHDMMHIKDIHKKFGNKDIKNLPLVNNIQRVKYKYIFGIKSYRPLNYIDYNKLRAIKELNSFCGFNYYELKHCENTFTKIAQLYWLPKKFNDDKRTSHLSSMIVSGQLTREEALQELSKPQYDENIMEKDLDLVLSKFEISRTEFDEIINRPGKSHSDYKTSFVYSIIKKYFKKTIVLFRG